MKQFITKEKAKQYNLHLRKKSGSKLGLSSLDTREDAVNEKGVIALWTTATLLRSRFSSFLKHSFLDLSFCRASS